MFWVSDEKIDLKQVTQKVQSPESGALVTFEGWVRNHNEGKNVKSLEYEVYETLANKEAEKVLNEAFEKFKIHDIVAVHRKGHLEIGDVAIWVGVSSAHRDAAFRACRYVIDEIKLRLPIWKKEYYSDEEPQWVNCQGCYHHSHFHHSEEEYYSKQIKLKNLGLEGQDLLKKSRVLVVGAGGLGAPALSYLAGAGIGTIGVCDGDRLEVSNLHRQTIYSHSDIGQLKSELAKARITELNPFVRVQTYNQRLTLNNALEIIKDYDLVLDCTDNFEAKFVIHDACFLSKTSLVQASVYQYEGQIQSFDFSKSAKGCMRCEWPDIPDRGCVGSCVESGVLGVVPGLLGTMQATEAIKLLLDWSSPLRASTLIVDLLSFDMRKIKRRIKDDCPLCGDQPKINLLEAKNYDQFKFERELSQFSDDEVRSTILIDIRDPQERDLKAPWENICHVMSVDEILEHFEKKHESVFLIVCQKGFRSQIFVNQLRENGVESAFSLKGGVSELRSHWPRVERLLC